MRIGLDSNILACLVGVGTADADRIKVQQTIETVENLRRSAELVVPIQALGELYVVLFRNGVSRSEAREVVADLQTGFATANSSSSTLGAALGLAADHRLQFWDSMIISAAAEVGCSLLLSEDMQDGFAVLGLTVVNPLTAQPHEKLARLLASPA